ncbi:hypothetical protein [Plantibacter sp. YIM 135249]|uniref:hypothetical protein n=1 Tax=Plantibacter sp. YIM 135249 TaxID=3423918 RepID=UPI003D346155
MHGRRSSLRTFGIAAAALTGALLLAGCSGAPFSSDYAGVPTNAPNESSNDPSANTPVAVWTTDGTSIALTTFGSSSCPAAPTKVEVVSATKLSMPLKATGGEVCTADFAPHTYEIPKPDGIDASKSITIDFGHTLTATLAPAS